MNINSLRGILVGGESYSDDIFTKLCLFIRGFVGHFVSFFNVKKPSVIHIFYLFIEALGAESAEAAVAKTASNESLVS